MSCLRISPALTLAVCLSLPLAAAEFHVHPQGSAEGDGSRERPWSLPAALAHPAALKPGDVLLLHGGVYRGSFRSDLKGREGAPIVVRPAATERVTVQLAPNPGSREVAFYVYGEHARFESLEVACDHPKRTTELNGSWPADLNRGSVEARGSHLQFINLVVHDLGNGFGFWSTGTGGEIYGCLIYHNGWRGPDRGHGHGIYAQNETGVKRIEDNILFNHFGQGMQVYGSTKAALRGFRVIGNVSFNNGCLSSPGERSREIHVGGEAPLEDAAVDENMTYGGGVMLGYPWGKLNRDASVARNYFAGGFSAYYQDRFTFAENTVVAAGPLMQLGLVGESSLGAARVDRNFYFATETRYQPFALALGEQRSTHDFAAWQTRGFDKESSFHKGPPAEARVFVRPNKYVPGRAHVAVYNWPRLETVSVDLAGVLRPGQRYRIVSAQNFFGGDVISGTYDGKPIELPMKQVPVARPVGMPDYELPVTEPEFGAFVVLPE
jgi:hypothetical protein